MPTIDWHQLIGSVVTISQPSALRRDWVLSSGERQLATLSFRSSWGTLATATSPDGSWTFKRMGFLHPRVTVRAVGLDRDLGIFFNNTWRAGGTLDLGGGRELRATTNFWQTRIELQNEDERPLLRFHTGGFVRLRGELELLPGAADLPEISWLPAFGWYLAVLFHMDSAAAAT
jgi:hypothetical protein